MKFLILCSHLHILCIWNVYRNFPEIFFFLLIHMKYINTTVKLLLFSRCQWTQIYLLLFTVKEAATTLKVFITCNRQDFQYNKCTWNNSYIRWIIVGQVWNGPGNWQVPQIFHRDSIKYLLQCKEWCVSYLTTSTREWIIKWI